MALTTLLLTALLVACPALAQPTADAKSPTYKSGTALYFAQTTTTTTYISSNDFSNTGIEHVFLDPSASDPTQRLEWITTAATDSSGETPLSLSDANMGVTINSNREVVVSQGMITDGWFVQNKMLMASSAPYGFYYNSTGGFEIIMTKIDPDEITAPGCADVTLVVSKA